MVVISYNSSGKARCRDTMHRQFAAPQEVAASNRPGKQTLERHVRLEKAGNLDNMLTNRAAHKKACHAQGRECP
jgi:hypothetical protein